MPSRLRVFAFSGAWGLPSTGPFALKLLSWLQLAGIDHDVVYEDDSRKGPKGKNPWVELDGQRMADSQLIIDHLRTVNDVDPDAWLDDDQRAVVHAFRRMIEEHLHQAFEYELIVHDDGYPHFLDLFGSVPKLLRSPIAGYMRGHFKKQLTARGLLRHSPDDITAMGIADVDAVVTLLGDKPYLLGDRPCSLDAVAFGFLALFFYSPLQTPVATRVKVDPALHAWLHRLRAAWFPVAVSAAA